MALWTGKSTINQVRRETAPGQATWSVYLTYMEALNPCTEYRVLWRWRAK